MPPKRTSSVWKEDGSPRDSMEASANRKRPRKQLQRRATDEQVDRCLAEHFKGWWALETHGPQVEGMSLADRIRNDKKDAKITKKRLGSTYWQELREMYASGTSLCASLKVTDSKLPVADSLIEAIKCANSANVTKRTKAPLSWYLSSCRAMNQRELVGLLRHLTTIRPASSTSATTMVLDVMRCLLRLNLHTKEKSTVDLMRHYFDEALCAAYAGMRREGRPTAHFWEVHGEVAAIVVDRKAVDAILAEKGSWLTVAQHLKEVTAASDLGSNMFSTAATQVISEEVGAYIEDKLKQVPAEKVTTDIVKAWMDTHETALLSKIGVSSLVAPRDVKLHYRTIPIAVTVLSMPDELNIRLACHLKQRAVGGHLPPLSPEAALLPETQESFAKLAVDAQVVSGAWRAWLATTCCLSRPSMRTRGRLLLVPRDPPHQAHFALMRALALDGAQTLDPGRCLLRCSGT